MGGASEGPIVFYDGSCGFCAGVTQFIVRYDTEREFYFASIQSDFGSETIRAHGHDPSDLDTFFVLARHADGTKTMLSRGRAAVYIASRLGGIWRALAWLRILPEAILDTGYNLVARNRYLLGGKREACLVPDPAWRERFIG